MNDLFDNKRIILITGSTETLSYFSKQMGAYYAQTGLRVFYWDMTHPSDSYDAFLELDNPQDSILITFNFIGLCGEGQFANGLSNVWDVCEIEKVCIMVDSPVYYYRQLSSDMLNLKLVCIDREHVAYVKHFYPQYGEPAFIPLAGNLPIDDMWLWPGDDTNHGEQVRLLDYDLKPLSKRHIDMAFIGNYVTVDSIMPAMSGMTDEYKEFVMDVANSFISHPQRPFERELYHILKEEFPDEEEADYPQAMFHMIFVDLYIRTYFRAEVVRTLADEGYKIHCVGKDWDKLECKHPQNIICTNAMMTSADCVKVLANSKISLNVMPWFKAGAHDRIFSSMLSGCVTVTDGSSYLDDVITEWKDYVPYTIGKKNTLISSVNRVCADKELAQSIADNGRITAINGHTWKDFAVCIMEFLNENN